MKKFKLIFIVLMVFQTSGCAFEELRSPCPEFGKYCKKIPILDRE